LRDIVPGRPILSAIGPCRCDAPTSAARPATERRQPRWLIYTITRYLY